MPTENDRIVLGDVDSRVGRPRLHRWESKGGTGRGLCFVVGPRRWLHWRQLYYLNTTDRYQLVEAVEWRGSQGAVFFYEVSAEPLRSMNHEEGGAGDVE